MNQLNQNIIRNRNCLQCYKIERKLPEKWEHFQDIIFNSRIFTVLVNKHTEIEQVKPMLGIGSFDGSFKHIHPANPTTYYQKSYKITEWKKSVEPRKMVGYSSVVISDLIKNQGEIYPFELESEKEWENTLEFYRNLLSKKELTFEKVEYFQDFLKEFQRVKYKLVEPNSRTNIANEEWTKKQNEPRNLADELKEAKIKYDKIFDLCLKLIEKIPTEKKNSSLWEKMERIKLVLETLSIPATIITELLKKK
ncbi:MAG: hypothetical protein I3273_00880 [Candidatus Moeniiplasma glomeromycotorum]|nr:hypothetical protein [Candidatus Moeniiplasma glomeromycotorum]MCE8167321.1 hypothetical protein [Candidatus Moeniiplasma glomeromycotorum]MCE8168665.1 hypothetical protein [Candidatus Moeniiplasma glomeromycotorum]